MPRVNPRNNPPMTRVITTPPPPKKVPATPPPQAKIFFPKRPNPKAKPTHRPITFIPTIASTPPQSRNVSQPVKKPTDWCGCEFWDIGCKAGCFSQEQIVDPVVSGTEWLAGGADVHVTQPITEGVEWWTQGATDAVASTQEAFDVFGKNTEDAVASTQEAIDVFVKNTQDAWDSTMQWGADAQTNLSNIGGGIQETLAGGTQWLQEQAGTAGNMFTDMSALPRNLGAMMGNMMRGMGNIANVGSSSFGWIKWVLIAVGALIAGFIAWRVLK